FLLFQQGVSTNWPKDSLSLFHVPSQIRYSLPLHGISRIITLNENFVLLNPVRASTMIYHVGERKPVELLTMMDKSGPRLPLLVVNSSAAIGKDSFLLPTNYGLFLLDLSTRQLRKMNL